MAIKESVVGRIPDTWKIERIIDLAKVVTDYVANGSFASLAKNVIYKDKPDYAILIRLKDFNNGFKNGFVYIDKHAYDFLSKSKLEGGEIIISNVGDVGTVFKCPYLGIPMSLAPNAIMVKFKGYDDFYYYWFKSNNGQQQLKSIITGSAQPKFNKTNFRQLYLPVPPLSVQKKIASILSSLDDKIELNNKMNTNLYEQAMTIFKEWFIDNPVRESWKEGTFSDIITKTIGGDWGKDTPTGNNTEKVYCIRGADIPEVKVGNKGKMPFRYILPKNYENKKLSDGDLVIEISGGSPTQSTGRIILISKTLLDRYDHGLVCTNFCRAITPIDGYSYFIYHYWQYLYDIGLFFNYENGTTGIKNFDYTGFTTRKIIRIPNFELVIEFNEYCKSIFDKIFTTGLQNEKLAEIRDTILPKLMSGEIDVEDLDL